MNLRMDFDFGFGSFLYLIDWLGFSGSTSIGDRDAYASAGLPIGA